MQHWFLNLNGPSRSYFRVHSGLSWESGSVGSMLACRFPVELMKSSFVIFLFRGDSVRHRLSNCVSSSSCDSSERFDNWLEELAPFLSSSKQVCPSCLSELWAGACKSSVDAGPLASETTGWSPSDNGWSGRACSVTALAEARSGEGITACWGLGAAGSGIMKSWLGCRLCVLEVPEISTLEVY